MLLIKGIWQLIGFMCKNKAFQGQLRTECIIHTIPCVRWWNERGASESTRITFREQKILPKQNGRFKAGADLWEKWMNKMNTARQWGGVIAQYGTFQCNIQLPLTLKHWPLTGCWKDWNALYLLFSSFSLPALMNLDCQSRHFTATKSVTATQTS